VRGCGYDVYSLKLASKQKYNTLAEKKLKPKRTVVVAQMVDHLCRKPKVLSSNPSIVNFFSNRAFVRIRIFTD
jgi:hypothetical protein